ncbi:MAG: sll0787 family AIR synthase-like protein [Verrucomicrobiota bacterium]
MAESFDLYQLAEALSSHPAIIEKASIQSAYLPAAEVNQGIPLGDDCAAIPDPETGGHLLFAAEGMLASFVADDPWFAGYSAVMVNLSDIAAMGGRPIAITNVIWKNKTQSVDAIWEGMRAASQAYNVPIVGGHTTQLDNSDNPVHLAAAVLGRAGRHLLTSFDAQPGDRLTIAIDMNGAYRKEKPFWNASTTTEPAQLQRTLALLPELAEKGLCKTAKDISNGGIIGTLAMLIHSSGVGATLELDSLPIPAETSWLKWLTSFPSYGYLLAIPAANLASTKTHFSPHGINFAEIGTFNKSGKITIRKDTEEAEFI